MIITIFSQFLLILSLALVIYKRDHYILLPMEHSYRIFSELRERFGDSFGPVSGNALLLQLNEVLYQKNGISSTGTISFSQYKFYTDLILDLLRGIREYGGGFDVLYALKGIISKELRFDRSLRGHFYGALVQFMAIAVITWGFALLTNKIAGVQVSFIKMLVILLLQGAGFICFISLFIRLQKREFGAFQKFIRALCTLRSLSKAGMSVQRTLEGISLDDLPQKGELRPLVMRLERAIFSYSNLGVPMTDDLDLLMDDLWATLEYHQIRFSRFLAMLKFLVAAIFFFSSYLIYLLSLFSQFLN